MCRTRSAWIAALSSCAAVAVPAAAGAHHSYGEYDRCSSVTFEGTIDSIMWANPHVVLNLATDDVGAYVIEWGNLRQLRMAHVEKDVLKPGDRVLVTGSVNRNPDRKIVTLLSEIRRPSDGWTWTRVRERPESCTE